MFNFKRKNKRFLVMIISKNKSQKVEVLAKTSKEAISMVEDVLLKCSIFNFSSKNDFELKCLKKLRRNRNEC